MNKGKLLLFLLMISGSLAVAQNKPKADSLKALLAQGGLDDASRAQALNSLVMFLSDPDSVIWYARLQLAGDGLADTLYIQAHQSLGSAYRQTAQLERSLEALFASAERARSIGHQGFLAEAYAEIGATYCSNGDFPNALLYEYKAIALFRQLHQPRAQAINLLNVGYFHYLMEAYDSAIHYYNVAEPIFDSLQFTIGQAYLLGNRALVYGQTAALANAETDLRQAIAMLEPLGDQFGLADFHNQLGNVYRQQGKTPQAIVHLEQGLSLAKALDLKEQIRDASLALSEIMAAQQQYDSALAYHQQYVAYKDSVANNEQTQRMADLRTEYEVNVREAQIDVLEKKKRLRETYIIIAVILFVLALVVLLYFRQRWRAARFVAATQQKEHDAEVHALLKHQETEALQAMVQGKEAERHHLAQELHNHLGTLLATAKINVEGLTTTDPAKHQTVLKLVEQACQDVRNLSHEMHMGVSENFGLDAALKELVSHLRKSRRLAIAYAASLDRVSIEAKSQIVIYRIVQELISNVLKHARATKLSISLTGYEEENLVNIMVEDNGVGFAPRGPEPGKKGIGLDSLHEMVSTLDGEMSIDSRPGIGTTVNIDFPFSPTKDIGSHD